MNIPSCAQSKHRRASRCSRSASTALAGLFLMGAVLAGGKPPKPKASPPPAVAGKHAAALTLAAFAEKNPESGQEYNASGIIALPEGRLLFVDNNSPDAVFLVSNPLGCSSPGAVRRLPLNLGGSAPGDFEGLTQAAVENRTFVFAASSLSPKGGKKAEGDASSGLIRLVLSGSVAKAEGLPGFRQWLLQNCPFLAEAADKGPDQGGINVEGLAWDPQRHALLLGFRSPMLQGAPWVLPLHVKDLSSPWSLAALECGQPIRLEMPGSPGGLGIRGMEFDPDQGGFLVILGNVASGGKNPFTLCFWDGGPEGRLVRLPEIVFEDKMKPESLTPAQCRGRRLIFFADDSGGLSWIPADDRRLSR